MKCGILADFVWGGVVRLGRAGKPAAEIVKAALVNSDIDLRIDKGAIRGLQLGGLAADLEDALGIPVDLIPTGSLDSKFLNSISDDEVLLYEAS